MDIHGVGTSFRSYVAAWNMYDRLVTFGRKKLADGTLSYDYSKIEPELAESYAMAPDGKSVTFKIRKDAKFHDGAPVTAHDVKCSRSEEHTSELQSLMRISYADSCLNKKQHTHTN